MKVWDFWNILSSVNIFFGYNNYEKSKNVIILCSGGDPCGATTSRTKSIIIPANVNGRPEYQFYRMNALRQSYQGQRPPSNPLQIPPYVSCSINTWPMPKAAPKLHALRGSIHPRLAIYLKHLMIDYYKVKSSALLAIICPPWVCFSFRFDCVAEICAGRFCPKGTTTKIRPLNYIQMSHCYLLWDC